MILTDTEDHEAYHQERYGDERREARLMDTAEGYRCARCGCDLIPIGSTCQVCAGSICPLCGRDLSPVGGVCGVCRR